MRSPDPSDAVWPGYDRFANAITGEAVRAVSSSHNVLPLVVFNHGPKSEVAVGLELNGTGFEESRG